MSKTKVYFLILFIINSLISGCFPFGEQERTVVGKYRLVQWEDGTTYYLHADGLDKPGGGVLEGTVKQIGWDDRFIIVWRYSNFRGDPDGWMIIEHQKNTMTGPFSDEELSKHSELSGIATMEAAEAWEELS